MRKNENIITQYKTKMFFCFESKEANERPRKAEYVRFPWKDKPNSQEDMEIIGF